MPIICQALQLNGLFPYLLPNTLTLVFLVGSHLIQLLSRSLISPLPFFRQLFASPIKIALDYRLAPETCFPGPLHDAVSAYFRLVEDLHIPPENIILAGDSAGGALSLALLMYLRDNAYALPSSAILMCPWVGE